MKFKVKSNKPGVLKNGEMEIEAVDESAAISEFVRANGIPPHSSSAHKFTATVVGEDTRQVVEESDVEEPEPEQVVAEKPKKPTRKKTTKKAE